MKKIFLCLFILCKLAICDDKNITKIAIQDSNAVFELKKQASNLEAQKVEICTKIFEIIENSKKGMEKNDMDKYNKEFTAQSKKNIKNLDSTDKFEENICLRPEPKMYIKNTGPFDGVPYYEKSYKRVCDKDMKECKSVLEDDK
ncbi:MAG: hypothetical protein J6W17_03300 [Campylobacter sp.]|nr:hypothetical protein [Campylobacter sp.]